MSNKNEDPTPTPWSEGDERATRDAAARVKSQVSLPIDRLNAEAATYTAIRTAITAERARVAGERAKEMEATRTLAEAAGRVVEAAAEYVRAKADKTAFQHLEKRRKAYASLATALTAWRAAGGE